MTNGVRDSPQQCRILKKTSIFNRMVDAQEIGLHDPTGAKAGVPCFGIARLSVWQTYPTAIRTQRRHERCFLQSVERRHASATRGVAMVTCRKAKTIPHHKDQWTLFFHGYQHSAYVASRQLTEIMVFAIF